jgi:hypothetical protein
MNDPIDQFLESNVAGPAPPGLQEAVLAKTMRVVRRRRLRRRLAWAGAMAACFLTGVATVIGWQSLEGPARPIEKQEIVAANRHGEPTPPAGSPDAILRSLMLPARPSALELEWQAFDSRDNRATLFFEVARRYLEEEHDYDSALRCYRQALDAARAEELAIRPDDNWLVMALKEARQKENNDAMVNR